jgi:hypothetical protein
VFFTFTINQVVAVGMSDGFPEINKSDDSGTPIEFSLHQAVGCEKIAKMEAHPTASTGSTSSGQLF